jgi:hypothetical protein
LYEIHLGETDRAKVQYLIAAEDHPASSEPHFYLGVVLLWLKLCHSCTGAESDVAVLAQSQHRELDALVNYDRALALGFHEKSLLLSNKAMVLHGLKEVCMGSSDDAN